MPTHKCQKSDFPRYVWHLHLTYHYVSKTSTTWCCFLSLGLFTVTLCQCLWLTLLMCCFFCRFVLRYIVVGRSCWSGLHIDIVVGNASWSGKDVCSNPGTCECVGLRVGYEFRTWSPTLVPKWFSTYYTAKLRMSMLLSSLHQDKPTRRDTKYNFGHYTFIYVTQYNCEWAC